MANAGERTSMFKATNIVLFIICMMYLITYIDRVNLGTAGPAMRGELKLSNEDFGWALAVFSYPYAFFQLAGGWVGDKLGPRMTLIIFGTIWSLATVLIGFVDGLATLIAARILLGIGEGAAFPTATRALAVWLPASRRGWAQGITHSFARIGNAMAPAIIAFLIVGYSWNGVLLGGYSWRGSFIIVGVISFIWVLVWALYFRDDPHTHASVTQEERDKLPPPQLAKHAKSIPWGPLLLRMLPVTLTDFCYGWILWLYLYWLPTFFLQEYKLDLKQSALMASGILFAGVVGDTVGGLLSDGILRRTGSPGWARVSVIVLGFLGCFGFLVPVLYTHDLTTVALCLSAAFFFAELIVAPIWAVPMDIAPEYSGTASGFMNLGFGIAGMISPVIIGKLLDATGRFDYTFMASLGFMLLGAFLALFMRPGKRFIAPEAALKPAPASA